MDHNLNCLAFIPVRAYNDALSKKKAISKNKGKSGIYSLIRRDSNKSYIGSSLNLGWGLRNYYSTTVRTYNDAL